MSHYPPPATLAEWAATIAAHRWAVYELAVGHHVGVARPGSIQALCTCGWVGPDRTDDDHAVGLVIDDVDWHGERVAADAAALVAALAHPPRRAWWETRR